MSSNTRDRTAGLLIPLGTALCLLGLGMLIWISLIGSIHVSLCGWLIVGSGLIVAGGALFSSQRDLFWLNLFRGCLYGVLGFMIVSKPGPAQDALGLLVSAVLLVEGIFEITPFFVLGFRNRTGRTVLGVYCIVMGVLIWSGWPSSGTRFIELCLAIDMILNGYALVSAGVSRNSTEQLAWYSLIGKIEAPSASEADGPDGPVPSGTKSLGQLPEKADAGSSRAA